MPGSGAAAIESPLRMATVWFPCVMTMSLKEMVPLELEVALRVALVFEVGCDGTQ